MAGRVLIPTIGFVLLIAGCGTPAATVTAVVQDPPDTTAEPPADLATALRQGLREATTAQFQVTVDLPDSGWKTTGVLDRGQDPVALDASTVLSGPELGDPFGVTVADGHLYVQDPKRLRAPWVGFDLAAPLPEALGQVGQLDPTSVFTELARATVSSSEPEQRESGSEPLTHYAVVIEARRLDLLEGLVEGRLESQVWVDAEGRPRELMLSTYVDDAPLDIWVRVWGWGEPVTIEAPDRFRLYEPPAEDV